MYKKIAVILGFSVIPLLAGCGQKTAKEEPPIPYEEVVENEEVTPLTEGLVSTEGNTDLTATAQDMAQDATGAVNEMADAVSATTKPTAETIQQALKNAGIYQGSVDGKVGPKTKRAIETFQSQNGLKVDGKVGPKTWSKLAPYLTKQTEMAPPAADVSVGE